MDALTSTDLIGIDLAGPTNAADTAIARLRVEGAGLRLIELERGLDDTALLSRVDTWGETPIVGLDAPLSYRPGGGDREAERALRAAVRGMLPSGTVMAPTMTRMAYLTLRGISVARLILALRPSARIVEVHPAAHLALSGAPAADVRAWKSDAAARQRIVRWLSRHDVTDLPSHALVDHDLAALAAARAAWSWSEGRSHVHVPARPPLHPFDVSA